MIMDTHFLLTFSATKAIFGVVISIPVLWSAKAAARDSKFSTILQQRKGMLILLQYFR